MDSAMPAVPWHKTRRTETRQPLSQEAIVEAGIRILDAEGLAGVTMRRVAQELGTGPASLYAHVSNKDELCELMLEEITGEIRLPEKAEPERWKEQIKEICLEAQRVYSAHRDITLVSLGSIPVGANQLAIAEFMLGVLLQAGIPIKVATWSLDALGQLIDTDVYEGDLYARRLEAGGDLEQYFSGIQRYFAELPKERFPLISTMAESMMEGDSDQRFGFKLDVFLDGLERHIARD